MRLFLEVFGETIIDRELLRFTARAQDVRPIWPFIVKDMMGEIEEQFDTQGGHASGGWAPLADSTIAFKERNDLDPRILHATLRLRNSLTELGAEDQVFIPEAHSMTFSSDVEYGEFHMKGNANLPKRPPVAFTVPAKQRFALALQRYIVEGEVSTGAVGAVT